MNTNHDSTFIQNSDSYMQYTSLFEDFEIVDKLARKRIEENNLVGTLRCMAIMKLILNDLKKNILK